MELEAIEMTTLQERVNKALSNVTDRIGQFLQKKGEYLGLLEHVDRVTREKFPDLEEAAIKTEDFFKIVSGIESLNLPDKFWKTPEGIAISKAYAKVYGDDLIDLPDAAMILRDLKTREEYDEGKHRVYMNSLVKETPSRKPKLKLFYIYGAKYPLRVRRSEVLNLKKTMK